MQIKQEGNMLIPKYLSLCDMEDGLDLEFRSQLSKELRNLSRHLEHHPGVYTVLAQIRL